MIERADNLTIESLIALWIEVLRIVVPFMKVLDVR